MYENGYWKIMAVLVPRNNKQDTKRDMPQQTFRQ